MLKEHEIDTWSHIVIGDTIYDLNIWSDHEGKLLASLYSTVQGVDTISTNTNSTVAWGEFEFSDEGLRTILEGL